MFKWLKKIKKKKLFIWLAILALGFGGYWFFFKKTATPPQYTLTSVKKGSLITTVSGTGQVSAVNQIDLKPDSSGKVTFLNAVVGQMVKAGDKLAVIDQKNNELALSQARASLASSQANYNRVVSGTTKEDLKISQLSVDSAQANYNSSKIDFEQTKKNIAENSLQLQKNLTDLQNTYSGESDIKRNQILTTAETQISNSRNALDLLYKILNDDNAKNNLGALDSGLLSTTENNYQLALATVDSAVASLNIAKTSLTDTNLRQAKDDSLTLLNKTLTALNGCYLLLKNSIPSSTFTQATLDSYKSSVSSQANSANSGISSLQTAWQNLNDALVSAADAISSAKLSADGQLIAAQNKIDTSFRSLENAKAQYAKLSAPAVSSDVRSAAANLTSAQNQLTSAQLNYDKNIIISPIDGQIAQVNITLGSDTSASSAANVGTAAITVITQQKIAIIQLNEVDTAKIKVGQDTDLTLDALPDLKIKGKISEIAGVGVATQGVVNYNVKISFDTQDERIKPGMSISALITTSQKDNVLLLPNEAVKSQGDRSYIEVLPGYETKANTRGQISSVATPVRKFIEIGSANDTETEITSGLNEGDMVILRTVASSLATGTTQAGGLFGGGARPTGASSSGNTNSGFRAGGGGGMPGIPH